MQHLLLHLLLSLPSAVALAFLSVLPEGNPLLGGRACKPRGVVILSEVWRGLMRQTQSKDLRLHLHLPLFLLVFLSFPSGNLLFGSARVQTHKSCHPERSLARPYAPNAVEGSAVALAVALAVVLACLSVLQQRRAPGAPGLDSETWNTTQPEPPQTQTKAPHPVGFFPSTRQETAPVRNKS
jgi:hypothetical protein